MPAGLRPPVQVPVFTGHVFSPVVCYPYRIWSPATPYYTADGSASPLTLGTQFSLTQDCALNAIWWYSYSSALALPSICGIWDIATQSLVTEDGAPAWTDPGGGNAVAGDGWVFCDFTAAAVTLLPGNPYYVSVYQPDSVLWYCTAPGYWTPGSGLAGQAGITSGPVIAPDTALAVNGQGCNTPGQWEFPGTNPGDGEVYYADVEVTTFP